jgi:hypothetical protein
MDQYQKSALWMEVDQYHRFKATPEPDKDKFWESDHEKEMSALIARHRLLSHTYQENYPTEL